MYIYNVKMYIETLIKDQILAYYTLKHVPEVMSTGCFASYTIESDVIKDEIIIRYACERTELFDQYIINHAEALHKDVISFFPKGILNIESNFCKVLMNMEKDDE